MPIPPTLQKLKAYICDKLSKNESKTFESPSFALTYSPLKSNADKYLKLYKEKVFEHFKVANEKLNDASKNLKGIKNYNMNNNISISDIDMLETLLEIYLNGFSSTFERNWLGYIKTTRQKGKAAARKIIDNKWFSKANPGTTGLYLLSKLLSSDSALKPNKVESGNENSFVGGLYKNGWSVTVNNGYASSKYAGEVSTLFSDFSKGDKAAKSFKELIRRLSEQMLYCHVGAGRWMSEAKSIMSEIETQEIIPVQEMDKFELIVYVWNLLKGAKGWDLVNENFHVDKMPAVELVDLKKDITVNVERAYKLGAFTIKNVDIVGIPLILKDAFLGSGFFGSDTMKKVFDKMDACYASKDLNELGCAGLKDHQLIVFSDPEDADNYGLDIFGEVSSKPFMVILPSKLPLGTGDDLFKGTKINDDYINRLVTYGSVKKLIDAFSSNRGGNLIKQLAGDCSKMDETSIEKLYDLCVNYGEVKKLAKSGTKKALKEIFDEINGKRTFYKSAISPNNAIGLYISALLNTAEDSTLALVNLSNGPSGNLTTAEPINYVGYKFGSNGKFDMTLDMDYADFKGSYFGMKMAKKGKIELKSKSVICPNAGYKMDNADDSKGIKITAEEVRGDKIGYNMTGKSLIKIENVAGKKIVINCPNLGKKMNIKDNTDPTKQGILVTGALDSELSGIEIGSEMEKGIVKLDFGATGSFKSLDKLGVKAKKDAKIEVNGKTLEGDQIGTEAERDAEIKITATDHVKGDQLGLKTKAKITVTGKVSGNNLGEEAGEMADINATEIIGDNVGLKLSKKAKITATKIQVTNVAGVDYTVETKGGEIIVSSANGLQNSTPANITKYQAGETQANAGNAGTATHAKITVNGVELANP